MYKTISCLRYLGDSVVTACALTYNGAGIWAMRLALYLALTFLAEACWSQVAVKKTVAIFDFENAAVESSISSTYFQTHAPDIGKGVSQLLVTKLVQKGEVTVLERTAVDKVLAEQNLITSDRIDPITAAKLGRLLGVDAIILGSITHYEYEEKMKGPSWFWGGNASPTRKCDITAKVYISTRLVSPDTAEVLAVSQGIGETDRKGVKMDLRDTGGRLVMASGANSPVINESIDKAVAQLAAQLEPQVLKLPPRSLVISGLVADASESGKLILNVGSRKGVKVGDRLQVRRPGREIRDPASGKLLIRNDTLLGIAVVITVNDAFSIAHYEGVEPVKVSDAVMSITSEK